MFSVTVDMYLVPVLWIGCYLVLKCTTEKKQVRNSELQGDRHTAADLMQNKEPPERDYGSYSRAALHDGHPGWDASHAFKYVCSCLSGGV